MFKRSSIAAIAAAALMGLTLSVGATFAQDATTPTPAPTATEIPAIELGTGGTHINFWNGLTGSDGATMNDLLAGFVKDHPEISVTMQEIPWDTLYPKLQTTFAAGTTPPDLILLHSAQIPQFASYGVLMDIGSWYKDKGGFFPGDDISKITRDGMDYQGVTYGIPLDNHGRGLWISKNAFQKAGLDADKVTEPTNYKDWVALFQKLTLDKNGKNAADPAFDPNNVVQWGFTVSEWPRVNFMASLVQHGGNWISDDGKTVTINSDAGVAALQDWVDLVYKYHVSPPEAGFDSWGAYAAGTLAILPTGTWFHNQANLDTDIQSAVWPNFQFGDTPATYMGIHTFMVPATESGTQLDAVKTLVEWVSNNQKGWAASGQVPARLSVQADLDPATYSSNIIIGKTMAQYGTLDWSSPALLEMFTSIDPELSAALNNQKTAKQALDDAASRMQEALDRVASGG
jgi:ABC-type glycerol-3-phosphate transport system substrate-binding protein